MESNTKDRELSISRTLNAPIDLVWEVFANPEHIMQWWGPDGFTNSLNIMDFAAGGEWKFIMHGPDGTDYPNRSVFKEIVPMEKIIFEHFDPNIMFTITFKEQGDQTLLNWHMLFDTADILAMLVKSNNAAEGLKQNIAKLEAYLAARKG